jgi:hypothetical protein
MVWKLRHRRRIANRQLRKRAVVQQKGIQLYVHVMDVIPTRVTVAQLRLVRLHLHIQLLNDNFMRAVPFAFINRKSADLKGTYLRIRFLPGDLSHVVVIM